MPAPTTYQGFLDGLGLNAHIPYTDGSYSNLPRVIATANYVGVRKLRTGISSGVNGAAPASSYVTLAKAGIQFSFGAPASNPADLAAFIAQVRALESEVPGSVIGIEGPNEINNYPVNFTPSGASGPVTGFTGALLAQQAIYAAVKSDPVLGGVPVIYMTGYPKGSPDPLLPPACADFDNQHPYPQANAAPAYWSLRSNVLPNTADPAEPEQNTETGYDTSSTSPIVQAKWLLCLFCDAALQGINRVYPYEQLDGYEPGTPQWKGGENGWGIFDWQGWAKPAAYALHNLTTILADTPGPAAAYATPALQVTGLPATGKCLTLAKSDGATVSAVLWGEPAIAPTAEHMDVDAATVPVTVTFPVPQALVTVSDPMSGPGPVATYENAISATAFVGAHPVVVTTSGNAPVQNGVTIVNAWGEDMLISVEATLAPAGTSDAAAAITTTATATAKSNNVYVETPKGSAPVTKLLKCVVKAGQPWQIHAHCATFGPLTWAPAA